jgi:hypothetical protein
MVKTGKPAISPMRKRFLCIDAGSSPGRAQRVGRTRLRAAACHAAAGTCSADVARGVDPGSVLACSHQVAQGLMGGIRDPHRDEIVSPVTSGS